LTGSSACGVCRSGLQFFAASSLRRCGGSGERLKGALPLLWGFGDGRRLGRKSCLAWVGPVATAPVGVVPLLGGVAVECRHLPTLGVRVSSGESLDPVRIGTMAASSTS
jgi:hypothetical protein